MVSRKLMKVNTEHKEIREDIADEQTLLLRELSKKAGNIQDILVSASLSQNKMEEGIEHISKDTEVLIGRLDAIVATLKAIKGACFCALTMFIFSSLICVLICFLTM
jgi:hypothetical protein